MTDLPACLLWLNTLLLVPAVHTANAALLHLVWHYRCGVCGNHPQPDDGSHPVWSLLWTHEPVCWLRDNQARLPWLVDMGEYSLHSATSHGAYAVSTTSTDTPEYSLLRTSQLLVICTHSIHNISRHIAHHSIGPGNAYACLLACLSVLFC